MTLKYGWKATRQARQSDSQEIVSQKFYETDDDALNDAIEIVGTYPPASIFTYIVEVDDPYWHKEPVTIYRTVGWKAS